MSKNPNKHWMAGRLARLPLIIGSVLVVLNPTGCFKDNDPGNQWVDKNVADAYWCATIETATATGNGGNFPKPISYDDAGTTVYPTYCSCAPKYWINKEVHSHLGPLGSVITAADQQEVQDFRDQLFAGAVLECENMYTSLYGNTSPAPTGNDCNAQLVVGVSPIEPGTGTCSLEVPYDQGTGSDTGDGGSDGENALPMPEDHWSDYYGLSTVVVYDPTSGVYEIDDTFFNDMLDHPEWLLGDSAYIALDGSDWRLFGVVSGDVAHALGLQTGDILQYLNTYDVSTPEGALTAFGSLQTTTSFTLVVERRGSSITLSYDVI